MLPEDSVLFTAGHGFYHFAISQDVFDRSLYYNLLLQPKLAIPDHYLLQGQWMGTHLSQYSSRDSWLEIGLRNGFVVPYLRREGRTLAKILEEMRKADRRGFFDDAMYIAERLGRTPFKPRHWPSKSNSRAFGEAVSHYLMATNPPFVEMRRDLDPDDFNGFWARSRGWIESELSIGFERSESLLRAPGMLLSQMIQISGERVLGDNCGGIFSIGDLLSRVQREKGTEARSDLHAYYTVLCELYNRSLADTLFSAKNSPKSESYIAALHMWREELASEDARVAPTNSLDVIITLPKIDQLRRTSGDTLLSIRKSAVCERFFESLESWKAQPTSVRLQGELTESLCRYSESIVKQVGDSVGVLGLRPQFVSRVTDILRLVDKSPQLVIAMLAVGGVGAMTGIPSPAAQFSLFGLSALLTAAKQVVPYKTVAGTISPASGFAFEGEISISRR